MVNKLFGIQLTYEQSAILDETESGLTGNQAAVVLAEAKMPLIRTMKEAYDILYQFEYSSVEGWVKRYPGEERYNAAMFYLQSML